jgi:Barstar (barnase inhibitor)
MTAKADAIGAIYAQVNAPEWAAPNLDGLADVLRDLSWLPKRPVLITLPDLSRLPAGERANLLHVLAEAAAESSDSSRPVRIHGQD